MSAPPPAPPPQQVVVELEHPARRAPDDGSFARALDEPWASGRACVVAFNGTGRAEWRFSLEEPWSGTVWLRYASRGDAHLSFGWGALDVAELAEVALPATGGSGGKHGWGWAPLAVTELDAGEHAFTMSAAPLRLDCLVLGGTARPTGLDPAAVAPLTDAEAERVAQPLSPASPDWLAPFRGLTPPAWYDATRLCLHTRLGPPWREQPAFTHAAEGFAALGARAFVRHVLTRGEGPWWPSAHGPSAPWADADPVRGFVERAHEHGQRFVAYYRHLEDTALAREHPDWRCLDDAGRPLDGRNGAPRVCLGSPYLDVLEARLLELADLGVDGLYFDEDHWPRDGCWCPACTRGFRELTGLEMPARRDVEDPRYRRLLEYGALVMERAFVRLRVALKARHPDLALLIGSNRAPDPLEHFGSDRLWRLADGMKTEYGKGHGTALQAYLRTHPDLDAPPRDVWLALGWSFARDASEGRPPHVWCNGLVDARAARAATAAVIAHGGVANLDCPEAGIPDRATFGPAVALGNRMADALAGARPERWAAVHWPGAAREHVASEDEAYARLAGPLGAAAEALLRARRPLGITTDSLLAEGALEGCRVLLLPLPDALTAAQRNEIERFREAGGSVLEHGDGWDLDALAALPGPPWSVEGGPERLHVVAHRTPDGRRLIALANDPAWVFTERRVDLGGRAIPLPAGVDVAPEPCAGVVVRVPEGTTRVTEVVRGVELEVRDGRVAVPTFEDAALLALD